MHPNENNKSFQTKTQLKAIHNHINEVEKLREYFALIAL